MPYGIAWNTFLLLPSHAYHPGIHKGSISVPYYLNLHKHAINSLLSFLFRACEWSWNLQSLKTAIFVWNHRITDCKNQKGPLRLSGPTRLFYKWGNQGPLVKDSVCDWCFWWHLEPWTKRDQDQVSQRARKLRTQVKSFNFLLVSFFFLFEGS